NNPDSAAETPEFEFLRRLHVPFCLFHPKFRPIRTTGADRMTLPTPQPASADLGLVGLAVMGQNLVLNMADHGFKVAVYNRTTSVPDKFTSSHLPTAFGNAGGALIPAAELTDFVRAIKRPRRIVILVKAGAATDAVIDSLVPLLEAGDCILD